MRKGEKERLKFIQTISQIEHEADSFREHAEEKLKIASTKEDKETAIEKKNKAGGSLLKSSENLFKKKDDPEGLLKQ